jgi:sulfoxide reductase heme-binding subunit YedZ
VLNGFELPTAIDVSSVVGLIAIGIFTTQILLGLLLSVGYNPVRQWPRRRLKLFTFHNWLGYIGLTTALTHPLILLFSATAGFRLFDIFFPLWSPTQPFENTLGAIALYLLTFVVVTSYIRRVFAHHTWKLLHYTAYAAAAVFFLHGVLADPNLKNQPVDWIDAEKVYVEGCALAIVAASAWRFKRRSGARGRAIKLQTSHLSN